MKNPVPGNKIFYLIAIITVILWQFEFGRYLLYPFTILGTWFHEMGHGLTALILGGNFVSLEIYENGSGLATHSGYPLFGNIGYALIAAAGPIGPVIAGSFFILMSKKTKATKTSLSILGILMLASAILWVRPFLGFGFFFVIAVGAFLLISAAKFSNKFNGFLIKLIGVEACLSIFLSINYLFSPGANIGGYRYLSDTTEIAQNLFLPFWVWGFLILVFSVFMIHKSLQNS